MRIAGLAIESDFLKISYGKKMYLDFLS